MRLLLLPGLGADARMFDSLRSQGLEIVTPAWIEPERRESLARYARRLASGVDDAPSAIGGASFGGMVALEMAELLGAKAVVLIGSCTEAHALAPSLRAVARAARPLPDWVMRVVVHSTIGMGRLGPMDAASRALLARMVRETPISFVRWGVQAILSWPGRTRVAGARLVSVHGDRDRVIRPPRDVAEDEEVHVVRGAGHVVSMTHAGAVAGVIRAVGEERRSREGGTR